MVNRVFTYHRLLTIFFLWFVALAGTAESDSLPEPNLYIRVRSAECSSTKLVIKVEGIRDRPQSIILAIINDDTRAAELKSATVGLIGDEYVWTGLIPLGDFTANVSIGKTLLKQKFTNLKLLQQFQNRVSTLIQVRSGGEGTEGPPQSKISQKISIPTVGTNPRVVHLLLVGSDNKLAAQYVGLPVTSWIVDVAEGAYKLLVVAYYQNESQCRIDSRKS